MVEEIDFVNRHQYYIYDAFDRRVRKLKVLPGGKLKQAPFVAHPDNDHTTPEHQPTTTRKIIGVDFFWCGDQMSEEIPIYADGTPAYEQSRHWLYQEGETTPFARYERGKIHYVISDTTGAAKELLDEWGKLVWRSDSDIWGNHYQQKQAANDGHIDCLLRFSGQ